MPANSSAVRPQQVDAFVRDVVDPVLARRRADLDVTRGDVRV